MELTFHTLIFILLSGQIIGQTNLVTNPSFEDTTTCPSAYGQITAADFWYSNSGSPDYFNSCASSTSGVSVPNNFGGYRTAASGHAYCGLVTYTTYFSTFYDYREYVGTTLTNSLTVGTKYYFSMKACLSSNPVNKNNTASNNLGVEFSKNNVGTILYNNAPKINFNSINTDSINWTKYFASFVADSTYSYLLIGNFFADSLTQKLSFNGDTDKVAYYYIDDICISTDSSFTANWVGIEKYSFQNSSTKISPNPTNGKVCIATLDKVDKIKIINSFGMEVFSSFFKNQIDLSFLETGVYYIQLYKAGQLVSVDKCLVNH